MKESYELCATIEPQKENEEEQNEKKKEKGNGILKTVKGFIPICQWLPEYDWKKNISGDVIAGLTVGIMHVPQGMAYASLAGVQPVYGMYSSFFAAFIYMFFGTSRHVSIGVFAVASLMVGAVRLRLIPEEGSLNNNQTLPLGRIVDPMVLTSALTLLVGIVQMVLGLVRLGFLTTYLSDPLISGFTTGSAAHVLVSQLNKVFGVKLPRHEGFGMLPKTVYDLIASLGGTNYVALAISICGILFLDLGRTYLNPLVKKFSPIPPPLELILVVIGVIVSVTLQLNDSYGVKIVNHIDKGLPYPSLPDVSLFPYLISDAIPIAIVCYMFVMSMGKLFAKKHKYKTDPTQELYAMSLMSMFASFFPVYPVGASLSRSSVCEMSGAKTQLYTIFSSLILLTVILFIGPLLEPLPMCILACIVIVSLKSLFLQVKELSRLWKTTKYDFAIWLISCLATIITDVTTGLLISIGFTLLTVVLREQWPRFTQVPLLAVPSIEVPDSVRIIKFESPLHFANVTIFIDTLMGIISKGNTEKDCCLMSDSDLILVDCSSMSYVDTMGFDAFKEVHVEGKKNGFNVQFVGLHQSIVDTIQSDTVVSSFLPTSIFHSTLSDALRNNHHTV